MIRFKKNRNTTLGLVRLATPLVLALIFCMTGSGFVMAQDSIPENTLKALKDATVFVRVETGNEGSTGSGFLIGKQKEYAYIVTNEHVIRRQGRASRTVEVDFFSGTRERKSLEATVVSEDESRDLAVLRVRNDSLPNPVKLSSSNEIRETLPVYILGFPFGESLSTNRSGPNVTIGRGTISSVRSDDFGNLEKVQIDGDLNPGNSGGPIVFSDGTLMGVSVATVLGTNIGVGIPGKSLRDMLFGRLGSMGLSQEANGPRKTSCSIKAKLIDPLEKVKSVSFMVIDADRIDLKDHSADENGKWSRLSSGMKEVKLKIDGQVATGKTMFRGEFGEQLKLIHQVKFVNGRGDTFYTSPGEYVIRIAERKGRGSDRSRKGDVAGNDKQQNRNTRKKRATESEGWLGSARNGSGSVPEIEPESSNTSVAGVKFDCVDAKCQTLDFESSNMVPQLHWDAEHEHFFALSTEGLLRKISFPGLVEVTRIDIGSKCSWMQISKEGLCVLSPGIQDLIVLEPESLNPLKSIPIGEAEFFAASPESSLAYIAAGGDLRLVDLATGETQRSYRPDDFRSNSGRVHGFGNPTISPDGQYFFCVSHECMQRFLVTENGLEFAESGPRIGGNARQIVVSNDSQYVAMPAGGGNGKGYTTFVYQVHDIKEKILEAEGGAYPKAIGFDKEAGMVYGQNHGAELITFTGKGLVNKSYDFGRDIEISNTNFILVHPAGHQLVLLTHPKMVMVNLPK